MWKFKHLFMNTETGAEAPAGNAGGIMLVMAMVLKIRAAVLLLVLRYSAPARAKKARMTGYLKNTALWAMTENSTLKAQPANWRMLTRTLKSAWAAGTRRRKLLMSMRQR